MNSVTPLRRAARRSSIASAGGSSSGVRAPRKLTTGGRGRSAGSASSAGAPASAARQ